MIPVNEPVLNGNELDYLEQCIRTGWISSEGPFVSALEEKFAATVGRQYGVAVASGSAALDVAVAAAGIGVGDEVIMPTHTIISPAASVVRAGAIPVLVDSDPGTWNMDVSRIEESITSRTRAVIAVHLYGLPVDMAPLLDLVRRYNLVLIEDAAEMIGQTYLGQPCGSFGAMSTFSFYPNKLITTGEGGMVVTDDAELAERCRSFRNLCFMKERRFVHEELGWNYRMTNLQAAVGLAQLERLDESIARKRRIGARYAELLSELDCVQQPMSRTCYAENIYWVYGLLLNESVPLDSIEVMKNLSECGIGTRPFFWCMHEQPVFQRKGLFPDAGYAVAERLARRGFYIPSGLALTEEQMSRVSDALWRVLGTYV